MFTKLLSILGQNRGIKCACRQDERNCIWWKIGHPNDRAGNVFSSQKKPVTQPSKEN